MKSILKVLLFLFLINLSKCNASSPCNQLDSSCNPITSLVLERLIRDSANTLTFSPVGGTYKFDQFVTITSARSSNVIRYTTDGSEPTCGSGNIFTTPVPLIGVKTHALKAVACNDTTMVSTKSDQYIVSISPLSSSKLRFWYSADSIGTQNGMEVKVWNDYSGNANHLYASSNSLSNPTLMANALNGKPSVRFNSSQKHYMNTKSMNSYTGAKEGTGIMILKKYSSQSEEVYFSIGMLGSTVNTRNWRGNLTNPSVCSTLSPNAANCGGAATSTVPTTGYSLILFTVDSSGSVQYYYNGASDGTGTLSTPATFSSANTMFLGTGLNVATFLDAEVLEVLFFEQGLQVSTDTTNAICPLKYKYGFTTPSSISCP